MTKEWITKKDANGNVRHIPINKNKTDEKNDKMMYDRVTGSWRKVKYDKVAKLWYARHNGHRYDYYCPHCHVEYYPDAEDGIVAYDYEKQRPITEKELNEDDRKAIEYGECLYCNNNPAYMVMEKED